MKKESEPLTFDGIQKAYLERRADVRKRVGEFEAVGRRGSDREFWEEMVYCFFTGGCSARMGLRSVEAVRTLLESGSRDALAAALTGVHRYPNARARYVEKSRNFLLADCDLRLTTRLAGFADPHERRDWLVREKGIMGLGYKEASHFLRNIGYRGYAILDKHVLRCMAELKIIPEPKPPTTKTGYLTVEKELKRLAHLLDIDFDELDLVLWSMKTGEILK